MQGIEGYRRYAVYWAPPAGSELAQAGARWLGWDAEARRAAAPEGGPLAAVPGRYGFHATLKAPFRLREGMPASALDTAVAALAGRLAPAAAPGLAADAGLGFVALRPTGPCPTLDAVAASCVTGLDRFRAPPGPAEMARRRAEGLDARGEALLARWGYPRVLDGFQFHVTLTGPVAGAEAELAVARAQARFAPLLAPRFVLDALCLFGEPGAGQPFHLLRRHALGGDAGAPLSPCRAEGAPRRRS
ncbi:DUF1045 domain-containing protein [Limibaculum sp. FT325]|uniref:DUF1045 domain-containing protein n=1 Tax=Thermohalobaculum sediminis TaxID=2939436 RepID=UPI0020BFB502|nr:DUF1045 domain-containing protein [Limibaculum sediminis]MCL5775666.1 DUF1045 domain-containing protein [Limibaculum sediminis]